jgi:asparagine synthase (glutamine-hydrolysing)
MSGITGIFRRDGKDVDPADIKKMNDKISHRGPDGSRVWCEGPVAFGHQMLHTTQESLHEILPFEDEESGLVITADARIDNRKDLAPQLDIEDNEYVSDSYFILKAYEKWGEKCPEELLGDFAFAIWDKNKETLFCARDHWGIKPLYYYFDENEFLFGSEIKSLSKIPFKLNERGIVYYIGLANGLDTELTCYQNISRLTSAHSLTMTFKDFSLKKYWALDPNYKIELNSDDEYESAFRDIFTEAVRCRLRSVSSVGSMLSGGLDSSSVACVAQNILHNEGKNNLKTFSAVFDSVPESNERFFIEKVLSSYEFEGHFIKADEISPLENFEKMLWYRDQPLLVPNTFMTWSIYREAGENGVRVLLDGFDGDIIVSHGTGYLTELARTIKLKKLFLELDSLKKLGINPYYQILIIFSNLMPRFLKRKIFIWRENTKKLGSRTLIVNKEFKDSFELIKKVTKMNEYRLKVDDAHKLHYMSLRSGLLQWEMELLDSISVPFHVEQRHPFYDKRLVEFCLAIPTNQKLANGWDRSIMRRALSNILPDEIRRRKSKGNISFNFKKKFLKERKILDANLLNNKSLDKYVDVEKIQGIYEQCRKGETKGTIYLWHTIILSLWLRMIENQDKKKDSHEF